MAICKVGTNREMAAREKDKYRRDRAEARWAQRQRTEAVKTAFRPVSWFFLTSK
jgi:hypothetical protein